MYTKPQIVRPELIPGAPLVRSGHDLDRTEIPQYGSNPLFTFGSLLESIFGNCYVCDLIARVTKASGFIV